ncbi:MAG: hypothetical protein A3E19_01460 [Planctomycetes bacterium RIFCSPHIGHO2_12_FULL_52_36]|nr:MAG: hypothetical protein A3D89_03895 [Planctomycetes bacterium RIFCSPHIGHO2_02_FULL_52_58]OHB93006.1 MAG: hypothetical protein A3E19_01460 [Planctomycetes bacterium RIFCSPHIGHO2_12_FULL_52_36]
MKSIQEVGGQVLTIASEYPKGYKWYKLYKDSIGQLLYVRSGEEVVGRITWKGIRPHALAESASGRWIFIRRVELLDDAHTEIVAAEFNSHIATFKKLKRNSVRGVLEFPNGRNFSWDVSDSRRLEYAFTDADNRPLLNFTRRFLAHANVEIDPDAFSVPELPLLVLLGCYLVVIVYDLWV